MDPVERCEHQRIARLLGRQPHLGEIGRRLTTRWAYHELCLSRAAIPQFSQGVFSVLAGSRF